MFLLIICWNVPTIRKLIDDIRFCYFIRIFYTKKGGGEMSSFLGIKAGFDNCKVNTTIYK